MKNKNRAFTLAEVMVTMVILGILASILMPIVKDMYPDKNKVMFRKAYYVVERMVYELVNDEDLYPSSEGKSGLDNTVSVTYLGATFGGNSAGTAKPKFCKLFAAKVNVSDINNINCDGVHSIPFQADENYVEPSFSTTDGVAYYMPYSDTFFEYDTITAATVPNLYIDVNGKQAPNCEYNSDSCPKPDIFGLYLCVDGRIKVKDNIAKEYLKGNSSVKAKS